ncbi:unnamed protein product [Adineta ricciae]|uniref:G-protein coupled receptors family 1 profile domain-containing protein n=1 Tax=Adineta ricciae TaxID=249248 RepID=A0A813NNG6_ADIRI|nr:unnamed protein product [Adineta ricciae]CAF1292978.1 unnamed protein product [Adineta ricciae]
MSVSTPLPFTVVYSNIQQQLILYVYPIWLIFGIGGGILNLIVFSRPKLRGSSCCIYFFAASTDHILTLIIGIGPTIYALNHSDPQIDSIVFCKIRGYLFQITLMLSRWFVAFACIDRYALSSDSVNLRHFASKRIAYRCVIAILLVWSIVCSHRLIFYEIQGHLCGIITNSGAAIYHTLYVIIGGGILPAIIMIICAFLIRRNLDRKHKKRLQISAVEHQQNSLDHQVLILLSIQIICYIIFTTPQMCNLIYNAILNTIPNLSRETLALQRFLSFMAELMLYMFPVTSFYLYTLTSRTFRNELFTSFRLLPIFRSICTKIRIAPSASNAINGHDIPQPLPTLVVNQ